jgi:prepilin-type N-terminal cleavage/methylation domain-containing protein
MVGKPAARGVTLIEIMVAVVVVALALGPLFSLLSASNRVSNASAYEVMAVQYAAELGEQLQRLSPKIRDLRTASTKSIDQILMDPAMDALLGPGGNPSGEPYMIQLPVDPSIAPDTKVGFFVSPLDPNFTARRLFVRQLDASDPALTVWNDTNGIFWDVTVNLSWKFNPTDPITLHASYSFLLREDLI